MTVKIPKPVRITEDFIKKECKKGSLFLYEHNLGGCPRDWFDCVQFIMYFGIDQNKGKPTLILDEKESLRFHEALIKKDIDLFILPEKEGAAWQLRLSKVMNDKTNEYEICFLGGSMFRKFLDKNNIFYMSYLSDKGSLISASNLKYQKNTDDKCDVPIEENYMSKVQ